MARRLNHPVYLLDTNIWLERLLNQRRAEEVRDFLDRIDSTELCLSDFSLHSICVILGRSQKFQVLEEFIEDLFTAGSVRIAILSGLEIPNIIAAMRSQHLDFDDAYQYALVKRDRFQLVSFDADFDRSDIVRKTPAEVLAGLPPVI